MKPRRLQSATILSIVTLSSVTDTAGTLEDRSEAAPTEEIRPETGAPELAIYPQIAIFWGRRLSGSSYIVEIGSLPMVTIAYRATSHVAAWIVWHSLGVSLL